MYTVSPVQQVYQFSITCVSSIPTSIPKTLPYVNTIKAYIYNDDVI